MSNIVEDVHAVIESVLEQYEREHEDIRFGVNVEAQNNKVEGLMEVRTKLHSLFNIQFVETEETTRLGKWTGEWSAGKLFGKDQVVKHGGIGAGIACMNELLAMIDF